jgi:membrane protein YdbS with pleckstrin-like domain
MSLRAFHLFFIAVCGVLAAFCAAWAVSQYRAEPSISYAAGAVVSSVSVVALAVYGTMFQRKTRKLDL